MIGGKTHEEKLAGKPKLGDTRETFAYLPDYLPNGQWVWWEWVTREYTLRMGDENFNSWKIIGRSKDNPKGVQNDSANSF